MTDYQLSTEDVAGINAVLGRLALSPQALAELADALAAFRAEQDRRWRDPDRTPALVIPAHRDARPGELVPGGGGPEVHRSLPGSPGGAATTGAAHPGGRLIKIN